MCFKINFWENKSEIQLNKIKLIILLFYTYSIKYQLIKLQLIFFYELKL